MKINHITFLGKPNNYSKIDNYVSRSAQPMQDDFAWLKEQGVTDIINFRTMYQPDIAFNEEKIVTGLNMKYHNIPTITSKPNEEKVNLFLSKIQDIKNSGGKAHIHCKAGADRTGMYAFIYKAIAGISSISDNEKEWIEKGHNIDRYPSLRNWAKEFIKKISR